MENAIETYEGVDEAREGAQIFWNLFIKILHVPSPTVRRVQMQTFEFVWNPYEWNWENTKRLHLKHIMELETVLALLRHHKAKKVNSFQTYYRQKELMQLRTHEFRQNTHTETWKNMYYLPIDEFGGQTVITK